MSALGKCWFSQKTARRLSTRGRQYHGLTHLRATSMAARAAPSSKAPPARYAVASPWYGAQNQPRFSENER